MILQEYFNLVQALKAWRFAVESTRNYPRYNTGRYNLWEMRHEDICSGKIII